MKIHDMRNRLLKMRILPIVLLFLTSSTSQFAQSITYPKEIRGYKVERAAVELKESKNIKPQSNEQKTQGNPSSPTKSNEKQNTDTPTPLIQFGTSSSCTYYAPGHQSGDSGRRFACPTKRSS